MMVELNYIVPLSKLQREREREREREDEHGISRSNLSWYLGTKRKMLLNSNSTQSAISPNWGFWTRGCVKENWQWGEKSFFFWGIWIVIWASDSWAAFCSIGKGCFSATIFSKDFKKRQRNAQMNCVLDISCIAHVLSCVGVCRLIVSIWEERAFLLLWDAFSSLCLSLFHLVSSFASRRS